MYPRLQTLIKVDLSRNSALLQVRGKFTVINYRALVPLIRHAHALPGHPVVTVDVSSAQLVDPAAVKMLEDACRALTSTSGAPFIPVRIIGADDVHHPSWLAPRSAAAYSLAS